ncbi:MAG: response regulator [Anaerolineales bacterium]|jgi:CheY-like chemotaxis protein
MKKILIVEDVEINLELLVQLLEDKYHLINTSDGKSGVELAQTERPDLIIMDMSLPILDGWSATREIRSNEDTAHIPIIALSAHAMETQKQKALAAGCSAYLTKPIDEELLFLTLDQLMDGSA